VGGVKKSARSRASERSGDDPSIGIVYAAVLVVSTTLFVALVYGLSSDNYVFRAYDFREIFQFQKAYYRDALLGGRLPLWTPHTFSGWPFAANPLTQTFYPPALLALALPLPVFAVVDLILHLALAAVGSLVLLRRVYGLGAAASAFGGLVYACSGALVAHAYAGHIPYYAAAAYIPWILLAADLSARGANLRVSWLCAGAAALGLQTLSGGLPFVWLTLSLLAIYRFATLIAVGPRGLRALARECALLGAIGAGGLGLAAIQVLPTLELANLSNRIAAGWDYAAEGSLPVRLLPHLLLPIAPPADVEAFWEYYAYVGTVPFFLMLFGATRFSAQPRALVLVAIAGMSLWFALGSNAILFPLLWRYVPGFGLFREPARALLVLGFAVSLLAAIGLDRLTVRLTPRLATACVLLASVLTLADVVSAALTNRDRLRVPEGTVLKDGVHPRLVAALERDRSWYRFWFPRAFFRENHAYAQGARSIGGYDNLYLARYGRFVHFMADTKLTPSLVTILDPHMFLDTSSPFPFKILGVKYAYATDSTLRSSPWPTPHAWLAVRACRVASEQAALERMRGAEFDPNGEVLFEPDEADRLGIDDASCAAERVPEVEVAVADVSPEHLRIELGPHPRGFVVLSEIFYPGWRATADGRPVEIHRADSILRAMPVDAGVDRIDMQFAPASLRWGAAITVATSLLLLLIGVRARS
jgi:hypothetical protein